MKNLLLLFIFSLITTSFLVAQIDYIEEVDEELEYSRFIDGVKYNNNIIYVGYLFDTLVSPAVVCIDTTGTIVWNTPLNDVSYPHENYYHNSATEIILNKIILGEDGFIYVAGKNLNKAEYWKVDPNDGQVVWKVINSDIYNEPYIIKDYSDSLFLMYHRGPYQFGDGRIISLVNKSDGSISSNFHYGYSQYQTHRFTAIEVDSLKNVYFSTRDSIIKLSGSDFSTVLWAEKYRVQITTNSIKDVKFITSMNMHPLGNSLIINAKTDDNNNNYIITINSTDGSIIDKKNVQFDKHEILKVKLKGNYLYAIYERTSTSSTTQMPFNILKYDLYGDSIKWKCFPLFPGNEADAFSIDIDSNDNVYCTGAYSHGKWGFAKISSNGEILYQQTIHRQNEESSIISKGLFVSVINNRPYFVGHLDGYYSFTNYNTHLVALDEGTGEILLSKDIVANGISLNSSVIDIKELSDNKVLVLYRRGRIPELVCYNSNSLEVNWRVMLTNNPTGGYVHIIPQKMDIGPDGTIWVYTIRRNFNFIPPSYGLDQNFDSYYVYKISSDGQILMNSAAPSVSYGAGFQYYGLMLLNSNAYFLYKENGDVRYWPVGSYSSNNYSLEGSHISKVVTNPLNSSQAYIFGGFNNNQYCKLFDANNGTLTNVTFDSPSAFNDAILLDENNLIKIGFPTGYPILKSYNLSTFSLTWTSSDNIGYSEHFGKIVKSGEYGYILSSKDTDLIIRKVNLINGAFQWTREFDLSTAIYSNVREFDIAYDSLRGQLIVTGNIVNGMEYGTDPIIIKLDHLGTVIDTFVLQSEVIYRGYFNNVEVLSNGLVLVGGSYFSPTLQQSASILKYGINGHTFVYDTVVTCNSYNWPITDENYNASGDYSYESTIEVTHNLNLTIVPSNTLSISNVFVMPTSIDSCMGKLTLSVEGNPDFTLSLNDSNVITSSSNYHLYTDLCSGIHDLKLSHLCGDSIIAQIAIPSDSNYIFNNPFVDSLAIESLGVTGTNCEIYYNDIDTAYIESLWTNGNTVNVVWTFVGESGSYLDTTVYELNNGNGVYHLQFTVFCPFKSESKVLTVTQAIYFENGSATTVGINDLQVNSIAIYPNPTNDIVSVNLNHLEGIISVFDVGGKLLLSVSVTNETKIDLSSFDKGVYLFDIRIDEMKYIKRVVKL